MTYFDALYLTSSCISVEDNVSVNPYHSSAPPTDTGRGYTLTSILYSCVVHMRAAVDTRYLNPILVNRHVLASPHVCHQYMQIGDGANLTL